MDENEKLSARKVLEALRGVHQARNAAAASLMARANEDIQRAQKLVTEPLYVPTADLLAIREVWQMQHESQAVPAAMEYLGRQLLDESLRPVEIVLPIDLGKYVKVVTSLNN